MEIAMIENSPIVNDIRNIRKAISRKFGNDTDKYIDYLISKESLEKQINGTKAGDDPPQNNEAK